MPRRPRRNHSPAFEAKAAPGAIEGEEPLIVIAERRGMHQNQVTKWKCRVLEGVTPVPREEEQTEVEGPTVGGPLRSCPSVGSLATTPVASYSVGRCERGRTACLLLFACCFVSALGAIQVGDRSGVICRCSQVGGQALSRAATYGAPT